MAGFKTHITTSCVLGVGYGAAAYGVFKAPWPTCVLSGALCGISGMLPDLDSDSGVPLRESLAFAAAAVPMMLVDRFRHLGWSSESIVLAGEAVYLLIRFGVGRVLRKFTVHRGMFHSLPAALIFAELAFLLASGSLTLRYFKAGGVLLGFMSHLVLDEIYSVDLWHVRLKKSFGTAIKFWGESTPANLATYAQLAILTLLVLNDPVWIDSAAPTQEMHTIATSIVERFWK